jgi:hypothetical protein
MKNLEKIISIIIALALLLTTLPGATATASPSIIHEADDALLLMLASYNMLIDSGLASGNPRMASVTPQTSQNEVDILLDIYTKQFDELDKMGYSDDVKLRLVDELDKKLYALESKAQRLEAERQNRRRGGLLRRFSRALGRATGWVVSKAMEGTGKIVQYSIEEVGPQLLKDAVFSGMPLTGAAFRAKLREMIRNRVRAVVNRKIETRLAALASDPSPQLNPAQPASEPTLAAQEPTVNSALTYEEDLNQGTHTYSIVGTTTPILGNDGNISGKNTVRHEFTAEGVNYTFEKNPTDFYPRVSENIYEQIVDGSFGIVVNTLIYTENGFEWHSVGPNETHYYCTIIR